MYILYLLISVFQKYITIIIFSALVRPMQWCNAMQVALSHQGKSDVLYIEYGVRNLLYTRENVYTLHCTTCTNGERSFGFNINCQFAEHKLFLLSRSSMQCLKKAQIYRTDVPILYLLRFNFHLAFLHNL